MKTAAPTRFPHEKCNLTTNSKCGKKASIIKVETAIETLLKISRTFDPRKVKSSLSPPRATTCGANRTTLIPKSCGVKTRCQRSEILMLETALNRVLSSTSKSQMSSHRDPTEEGKEAIKVTSEISSKGLKDLFSATTSFSIQSLARKMRSRKVSAISVR